MLFTQPDHAALAAALLALWRRDGLPEHPRRSDVLLAIREHDNGWRETDAAPRISIQTGLPLTFHELADEDRIDLWRRGVHRFAAGTPFVAQLILRHALEIHRDYWSSKPWLEFGAELAELEQELQETSGAAPSECENAYRFLEIADTLSLGACGALGTQRGQTAGGYHFEVGLGRIGLDPFPLAGATTLGIAYRKLAKRSFDTSTDLAVALAVATWNRFSVRVEPSKSQ